MDDLVAFERQLEREVRRAFGRPRPVDVGAIVRGATGSANAASERRRRSRRWRFPGLRRRTETPSPIPATNGHAPTVHGKTQSMLSPAKAITAGAIVFAIGGVMLIAQPFQQQGSVPGATIDPCTTPVAPATGFIRWGSEQPGTQVVVSETGEHIREFGYTSTMEMEDDRLDGTTSSTLEWDFSLNDGGPARDSFGPFDQGRAGVSRGTFRIENGGGSWDGAWIAAGESTYSWHGVATLAGAGGYEGLSATLFFTSSRESAAPVAGSIYPSAIASCEFTEAD